MLFFDLPAVSVDYRFGSLGVILFDAVSVDSRFLFSVSVDIGVRFGSLGRAVDARGDGWASDVIFVVRCLWIMDARGDRFIVVTFSDCVVSK